MITVTKPYFPPIEEYARYVSEVWRSGTFTNNGPMVQRLERELAERIGGPHVSFVTNGTLALQLALRALDVTKKVITTPFSYVATTTSILWEHCTPVFVDVEDATFCIDPRKVEAAITPDVQAIMATHVYGYPCDVHALKAIADRHNLKIIYDGAHAFDARLDGESLLCFGDVTTLSFHATKLFHTVEGGALVISDERVARNATLLRSFGHVGDEYHSVGTNAKGSELHAAMGLCVLPHVKELIARRKTLSELYDAQLRGRDVRRPIPPRGLEYNYAYYPVVFPSEQLLLRAMARLTEHEIGTRRYFYPSLNTLPYVVDGEPCPVSEDIARRVLCLPLYDALAESDVRRICTLLAEVV